ncbi:Sf3a3 protein, related, partial [Eimeria necatrix]
GSGYKKKLLQAAERSAAAAEAAAKASEEEDRQIAFLEFRIKTLADMLREQINQTIAYHQKKQSTNAEEALEEDEQDSSDGASQLFLETLTRYKKKLLQAAERSAAAAEAAAKASEEEDRQIAFLEFRIKTLADMLREQINQTIAYHQKKQSTNAEEALEEDEQDSSDEEEAAAPEEESEAEEEEGPVYNPLNLPLGFDGRPIPYWLYKLHGLGQEFKCEICGNFSYWGRRAFERHFAEWRHSFGMRCLKIPNTTHFKAFKQDQELECEDADGNVMSLRAFEDLRRQGLL